MTPQETAYWADSFWSLVGQEEPFPRTLEQSIAKALPVAVVKLPRLTVASLQGWLKKRGIDSCFFHQDRRLRACLLADRGRGLIFVDGSDPADEQCLSLAHELAHFLLDYLAPRKQVEDSFGDRGLEVFDGERAAQPVERLTALLHGTALRPFMHLMERSPSNEIESLRILEAETRAGQFALELIAPRREVLRAVHSFGGQLSWSEAAKVVAEHLVHVFGLPAGEAGRYARAIVAEVRSRQSFQEWLYEGKEGKRPSNLKALMGRKK